MALKSNHAYIDNKIDFKIKSSLTTINSRKFRNNINNTSSSNRIGNRKPNHTNIHEKLHMFDEGQYGKETIGEEGEYKQSKDSMLIQ